MFGDYQKAQDILEQKKRQIEAQGIVLTKEQLALHIIYLEALQEAWEDEEKAFSQAAEGFYMVDITEGGETHEC